MRIINARLLDPASGKESKGEFLIDDGKNKTLDAQGACLAPALWDLHVHLREPGQAHKETIATGAKAASAGGVGFLLAMPNTEPAIDTVKTLQLVQKKAGKQKNLVDIEFIAAVTVGRQGRQLTDIEALARQGAAAFSDDGAQIKTEAILEAALIASDKAGSLIIDHCDEPTEEEAVKRDIRVLSKTPGRLHIAHVSTQGALEAIRKAKKSGLKDRLTCEVTPHHFTLTQSALKKYGTLAKVNPPLRSQRDLEAVWEALGDGTLDAIASDHAPHAAREKALAMAKAPPGMIGLETLLPLTITQLVDKKIISLMRSIQLLTVGPARILRREPPKLNGGRLILFDPRKPFVYSKPKSKSKNTPFLDWKLRGQVTAGRQRLPQSM